MIVSSSKEATAGRGNLGRDPLEEGCAHPRPDLAEHPQVDLLERRTLDDHALVHPEDGAVVVPHLKRIGVGAAQGSRLVSRPPEQLVGRPALALESPLEAKALPRVSVGLHPGQLELSEAGETHLPQHAVKQPGG